MKTPVTPLSVPSAASRLSEATNYYAVDGKCHNSNPGTYNHECGKPATWLGMNGTSGFVTGFCDSCKANGAEARGCTRWERIGEQPSPQPSGISGQFIIVYRPHGTLECETRFIGPYSTHQAAYDAACLLPAAGDDGVKYVDQLERPARAVIQPVSKGSVECPHCHWGLHPSAIAQHIREKHEPAPQPAADGIKRFEVGKTYSCRSFGDYDCIYVFEITGRTDKTLSMNYNGRPITRRIRVYEGVERISPFGRYSMSPLLTADKTGKDG